MPNRRQIAKIGFAAVAAAALLSTPLAAAEFSLRLATIFPESHPIGQAANALKAYVEEHSGGRMDVTVFPAGQLGGLRQIEDAAASGLLDITQSAAPTLAAIYPTAGALAVPYAFRDDAHLQAVWGGEVGDQIRAGLTETTGLHVLSTLPQPARHMSSSDPVRSVEDFKGLRVRVPQVPSWVAFFEGVGAVPTPIDLGELVTSLQLGVVNAQENPWASMESLKLYDVQKYLIPTGHVRTLDFFLLSGKTYDALPEDLRAVLMEAGKVAEETVVKEWTASTDAALASLQEKGMELLDIDTAAIAAANPDLYKEVLSDEDQKVFEAMQAVK